MVYQKTTTVSTRGHGHMQDVTEKVAQTVTTSGIMTGTANIFNVGSTGAIGVIEFEPGLCRDLPELLDRLIPPSRSYGHQQAWHDGNGHSHLQATLLGPSLTVPVNEGRLVLGTWQQIFHLERDIKPREGSVVVTLTGNGGKIVPETLLSMKAATVVKLSFRGPVAGIPALFTRSELIVIEKAVSKALGV